MSGERGWLQLFFTGSRQSIRSKRSSRAGHTRFEDPRPRPRLGSSVALTFDDVTRQREMEQAKSDFTSMIVHDLRGPLSGIQGTLDFILSSETRSSTRCTRSCSWRLPGVRADDGTHQRVARLFEIESGNFEVEKDPVQLAGILRRSVKSLSTVATRDYGPSAHRTRFGSADDPGKRGEVDAGDHQSRFQLREIHPAKRRDLGRSEGLAREGDECTISS